MNKTKHTHKLKRITYKSGNTMYFCVLDCNFKISPALALGKKSICWRCGHEFIMSEYSLRLAKPHCEGCHKPKNADVIEGDDSSLVDKYTYGPVTQETEPTLAERLAQTIQKAQTPITQTEELEDEI